MSSKHVFLPLFLLALTVGTAAGCQRAYFGALESLGMPKRDLFVRRVKAARESQQEGKEEFRDALEQFRSIIEVDGGELEQKYDTLQAKLDQSEKRAEEIRSRIESVEDVAEALFDEWEDELDQYSSGELRRQSEDKLERTRQSYERLIAAMHQAESRLDPVLQPLRDHVLFLKHNLNARAVASLGGELGRVEGRVDSLVREMEESIAEADRFLSTMEDSA